MTMQNRLKPERKRRQPMKSRNGGHKKSQGHTNGLANRGAGTSETETIILGQKFSQTDLERVRADFEALAKAKDVGNELSREECNQASRQTNEVRQND